MSKNILENNENAAIKSNKGSTGIPPLKTIIQEELLGDFVYSDDEKCELLNKYFSLISTLEDENVPIPDFEKKKLKV